MKSFRSGGLIAFCCGMVVSMNVAYGQIVINEIVKEEQGSGGAAVTPDTREFVELYNAGASPVNIGGWSLAGYDVTFDFDIFSFPIPTGATINPGDYYVIGGSVVPNVDFVPGGGAGTDLFADGAAGALLLRDGGGNLVDGAAYDVYRTGAAGLSAVNPTIAAQFGDGYHGRLVSLNANAPLSRSSMGRYQDGRDSNRNGYDFGYLPITPGTTNNSTLIDEHSEPNVDSPALAVGTALGTQYNASFTPARVIDPTVASAINPRALPSRSPQGGNAIIAWDESGGGNAVYSRELTNSFDIYAYIDTAPLGVAATTNDEEWEDTIYGIGSTDPYFNTPDPSGGIFVSTTANGSTGIGWVYQNYEDGTGTQPGFTKLMLVDFGDGGESRPVSGEWTVIQTIDMTTVASDWYRLGIDYDPATGDVEAWFDDQTFTFDTETGLLGNFFVGYREAITGAPSTRLDKHSPPTFDVYAAVAPGVTGDYNDDGIVDARDYTIWRDKLGSTTVLPNDDTPGVVDASDYTDWKTNFGMSGGSGALAAGAVPEPGSIGLLFSALAFGGTVLRRRT
jgi:hypothetical protein